MSYNVPLSPWYATSIHYVLGTDLFTVIFIATLSCYCRRQNKKFALGSACIGGGQGITVILEKC